MVVGEKPIDLDAVQGDDEMLDRIGSGGEPGPDEVERVLARWRASAVGAGTAVRLGKVMRQYRRDRLRRWLTGWWKR